MALTGVALRVVWRGDWSCVWCWLDKSYRMPCSRMVYRTFTPDTTAASSNSSAFWSNFKQYIHSNLVKHNPCMVIRRPSIKNEINYDNQSMLRRDRFNSHFFSPNLAATFSNMHINLATALLKLLSVQLNTIL